MLLSVAQWIQSTGPFTYLRESHYTYPVILSLHMVVIAFFGGMILMTDLRLIGWAMRTRPVNDVLDQLRVPKRIGFLLMAVFGILLFGCKAEEYYYNPFFRVKVMLLACVAIHALIFRGSVYNFAGNLDRGESIPRRAKLAAGLSLVLWTGIACMGRGIGYIDPPFDLHARAVALLRSARVRQGIFIGRGAGWHPAGDWQSPSPVDHLPHTNNGKGR